MGCDAAIMMERPASFVRSSWVVFLATFLTLSAMTLTSQGQPRPQVLLVTQPDPQYYVTKNQAVNITCEAYGATSIAFLCLGAPALPRALTTYQSYDDARDASLVRTTLKVRWAEVEAAIARGAGLTGEGGYWCQCTAQDEDRYVSVSSRRAIVSMAVLEKKFQESPVSQIVASGSQTILNCSPPHGEPAPQVSWRKDGHKVKVGRDDNLVLGADNSLTIVDTRLQDAGTYQCVVRNIAGRRQSSLATLIVEDVGEFELPPQSLTTRVDTPKPRAIREVPKPVFLEQPPEDIYITSNQAINIVCAVQGATRMTVRCNNQRIDPSRLRTQSDNETKYLRYEHALTFPEVQNYIHTVASQHYKEKSYKCGCVAWYMDPSLPRNWGSVLSTVAKIRPAYLHEAFQAQPRSLTAQVGTIARLRCGAPEGMPTPTVSWWVKEQRLDPDSDGRYTLTDDGTLTISNIDYNDEGRYYCIAENTVGIRRSEIADLRVSEEATPEPTTTTSGTQEPPGGYVATFPPVIPDSPVFLKELDSQYYLDWEGEAVLVCSVVSAQILTFRCMNTRLQEGKQKVDDQTDRASGKRLLTASTIVTAADVESTKPGDYSCQCVAWYLVDEAWHSNFSIPTTILPAYIDSVFVYEPRSGVFYAGEMVEFACDPPGGQPTPKVMWRKDGQDLDPEADDNIEILEDGRLIIDRAREADAGQYECVAFNPAGKRKSSAAVLEVYPAAETTPKHHDKMMTSYPTSTPVPSVTPDEYHLSTSMSGRIIPILILEHVPEAYIINNEPATLICGAIEATRLIFVCNGERVPPSKDRHAFKTEDPVTGYKILEKAIDISRQDVEDFQGPGAYICHCRAYYPGDPAEGGWDYVAATDTTVKIAYLDTQFVEEPVDQVVDLGVASELVCRPPMGDPEPKVHWIKDGYKVMETNNIRVSAEGSLVFNVITMADAGDYTCVANNTIVAAHSNTIRMRVVDSPGEPQPEGEGEEGTSEPTGEGEAEGEAEAEGGQGVGGEGGVGVVPSFLAVPESRYYIVRSRAVTITCETLNAEQINFVCNNESIPQSRVQYEDIKSENYGNVMAASIDISREEVENYNDRHGGNDFHCKCQAHYSLPHDSENKYETSANGYVEVAYLKKMFKREPFNITLEAGEFLSLPCEAPEGNPTPEVSWLKNGKPVKSPIDTPDHAFIINDLGEKDAGIYVCVATNVANTRKSRPGFIFVQVDDMIFTGDLSEGGAEPEGEPESTTADYEASWSTGNTKEQECMNILQSCSGLMPRGLPDRSNCPTAPRYIACIVRFQEECHGVINRESLEAAEGAKRVVENSCATGGVCEELMNCQSDYSKKKLPNADAVTMPMAFLCEGIHSFLRCAHSAAETCQIPQDDPSTSLTQLAEWFEAYCMKVVNKPWAKDCPSMSQCDLPIEQTTILSNLVQASLWCPYVKDTMECTWQAVRDCSVSDMEENMNSLDALAADTCPASTEGMGDEEDKKDRDGGEGIPGEHDNSIGKSETSDGDDNGSAPAMRASIMLTSLLPALLAWRTWR